MSSPNTFLQHALQKLENASPLAERGKVTDLVGLVLKATLPDGQVGDYVTIFRDNGDPLGAEVIGFTQGKSLLMPLGNPEGIGPGCLVERIGKKFSIRCGTPWLGRVLDGLGMPIDGDWPESDDFVELAVDRGSPNPLTRPKIARPLPLGIRAIDGLLTIGEGQRIGLFAGSGVGKSTLLGQIARNTSADVTVICLVGERGREVREFIEDSLGAGLAHSVVVCATSDTPPFVRLKSTLVATTIAEYFRDQGKKVLLLMDSVTRYARALREVALAAGEPPARRGYPPSVFAQLPRLLERTGTSSMGSITAIYTVLVEGSDMEEPVADEVRGILDGHIVLSRDLAQRGHWPAIDVLQSISRVMPAITDKQHQQQAAKLRQTLATYEQHRDLILLGAYQKGSDPEIDFSIRKIGPINTWLQQTTAEKPDFEETYRSLSDMF